LLIVCEDNGIGISVPSPPQWVADTYRDRDGLHYVEADGYHLPDVLAAARDAVDYVRRRRRPAFLHLRTVRLMGHAGSDVESSYRRARVIADDMARDPLLGTARWLVGAGVLTPDDVAHRYQDKRRQVARAADEVS